MRTLRDKADKPVTVPIVGPFGPMADSCIHLRDGARPLGSDVMPPPDDWRIVLDFLVSPAQRGFVPKHRLTGLRLHATDLDWHSGDGPTVAGPAEAVAMAVTGRSVALADLDGDGVPVLRTRIG